MNDSKKEHYSFSNPFSGATAGGLGGAAVTAIGAAIQRHNVRDETLSVLAGGAIIGAIAGSVGCCLPDSENLPLSAKLLIGTTKVGLSLMVSLAAPKMGNLVLGSDVNWSQTIIDGLIGSGVVAAGVCGVGACVVGPMLYSLFKKTEETTSSTSKAELPQAPIAVVV